VKRERPLRAVAYWPDGSGGRVVIARTRRARRDTLDRWLAEQQALGYSVDWWKVEDLPEVTAAAQAAAPPPALP
jgi:hypothetical protein